MKMDLDGFTRYYQKGVYPPYNRIYVIGDIHGDLKAFIYALRLANLIDKQLDWIGGKAHVVQIGDIMDRKPRGLLEHVDEDSEFKICALICKLQYQSYAADGGFHCVIGNHELMNVMGIHDYASEEGINHFRRNAGFGGFGIGRAQSQSRSEFFAPGSHFARYMACTWNPVVKIGDWVFVHGGISPKIAEKYRVDDINLVMRDYLYGAKEHQKRGYFNELFVGKDSILWNRDYSTNENHGKKAKDALGRIGAKHMVVGHTIQSNGIASRYGGAVWNVDTGMSQAFGTRSNPKERIQILEILNQTTAKILTY